MAYVVDRVVVCDAYREPERHYQLLPGGRSKLTDGRRPSMRFLASAKDAKTGISGVVGREAGLYDDMSAANQELNGVVNQLRDEVRDWRDGGYQGTAVVTRRLLEWWFEREEERAALGKRFFFCQREAIETVIYLYEVKGRHRMPETGDLLRYRTGVKRALLAMGAPSVTGPLTVLVTVYPPDRRRRDLDNLLKCLLDSLQHGGLYRDDSMIDRIDIRRGPCTRGGGVHVAVHGQDSTNDHGLVRLREASRGQAGHGPVWPG